MTAKKTSVNDEFSIDVDDLELPSEKDTAAVAKAAKDAKAKATRAANKAKKEAAAAKAEAELVAAQTKLEEAQVAVEVKKFIDPEDDRENWPTIHVEMEEGKPNYEYLAVSGTKKNGVPFSHRLQIMRGRDAQVPPSIVNMLRDAVSTHYSQRRDASGKMQMIKQERSSIPWRLIKSGKHIQ